MQDSLVRYVVRSILRVEPTREGKAGLLARLRDSDAFLIDLKIDPLDRRPLSDHVPDLVTRAVQLAPEILILIKTTVYDAAFTSLKREELPVIAERIPFPGSGHQKLFQAAMARALVKAAFDPSGPVVIRSGDGYCSRSTVSEWVMLSQLLPTRCAINPAASPAYPGSCGSTAST